MTRASLKPDRRVTLLFWAITLTGGGLWLLLLNFNLLERFEPTAQYILAGVLGAIGIGFFGAFLQRRDKWWRLIPGWLLLTLAAMVLLSTRTLPANEPDGRLIAAVLFWGLALAFFHVFLLRRALYWWAIIPSGFMLILGGVVVASIYITRLETLGALLSIGMGLVFVMLYGAARAEQGWWPLIPATVLILFGIAAYTAESNIQNALINLWPVLLIVAGIFLGWQAARKPAAGPSMEINSHQTGGGRVAPTTPTRTVSASAIGGRPKLQSASKSDTERATRMATPDLQDDSENEGELGAYRGPAPGASVDILEDDAPRRG